jgi:hypothetical protein
MAVMFKRVKNAQVWLRKECKDSTADLEAVMNSLHPVGREIAGGKLAWTASYSITILINTWKKEFIKMNMAFENNLNLNFDK